jgi:hypothetical protein
MTCSAAGSTGSRGVAPYDLATVFVLEKGRLVVRAARARSRDDRVAAARLSLDQFPSLREALETRRARTFLEADHRHGDGGPVRPRPGSAARARHGLVAHLWSPASRPSVVSRWTARLRGVPAAVVNLVEVYAQLLAIAFQGRRQDDHPRAAPPPGPRPTPSCWRRNSGRARSGVAPSRSAAMQSSSAARQVARAADAGADPGRAAAARSGWRGPFTPGPPGRAALRLAELCRGAGAHPGARALRVTWRGPSPARVVPVPAASWVANGGTLFLDESPSFRSRCRPGSCACCRTESYEPVGSASSRPGGRSHPGRHPRGPRGRRGRGPLREDLFYLLDVFPLELPPLRRATRGRGAAGRDASLSWPGATREARARRLTRGAGPSGGARTGLGNVRELATTVLERALIPRAGRGAEPAGSSTCRPPRREGRVREGELSPPMADATRQHIGRAAPGNPRTHLRAR